MITIRRLVLTALLAGFGLSAGFAADLDPAAQREQQKKVRAEVEQTARRIGTTLRVLTYQKLDANTEQKMLDEVAATLRGLSREQMAGVLAHLDKAVAAPDEATASAEQKAAYQKHRQVVSSLKGLLDKLDVLKSLDQAANKIDRLARDQHGLHLRATQADAFRNQGRNRRAGDDRDEQADAQGDLGTELLNVSKQLAILKPTLAPDQKDRLDRADVHGKAGRLASDMAVSASALANGGFRDAADRQLRTAKELQTLAAALRLPRDKVTALREARDKVEKAIQAEQALKAETAEKPKAEPNPRDRFRADPEKAVTSQLADRQSKLEFDTREIRKSLEEVAKEAAAKLAPAESEMRRAEDELREADAPKAVEPQANAVDRLTEAREELDKQIAAAEREKRDALAATKKAAEMVDKLLAEQKAAKQMTAEAKRPDEVKQSADAQRDVARQADELKNLPLPESKEAKEAINKAAEQSQQAADDLKAKDKAAAQPKQDEAVKALETAKKALEEKAKEIEQRRDELAKLADAQKKLDELSKEQKKVADAAKADPNGEKSEQLAQKQEQLTPPTKDVGEQVKPSSPDAAKKLDDAAKQMDAAKQDLQKKQGEQAAQKAKDAAQKLDQAKQELAKKADQLKSKEIADQAALQPNQVSPADAAQQIAKAIEQANKAADQAEQAADRLNRPKDGDRDRADLTELQKQIAERAKALDQPAAAKDAEAAAKALEKGELPGAVEQQQQAQDKLGEAAKGQPKAGEKQPGEPKAGEPKANGKAGEPKGGEPGEPKAGDAKPGQPKPGEPGQPSPADAKSPGELAQAQQQVKEATEALAKSSQSSQAAQAALTQAQATAPQAVQPQLEKAAQKLSAACQKCQGGKPGGAKEDNRAASAALSEALQALNQAAQAMGQQQVQPGQPMSAQANGQKPGQPGEGQQPGEPGDSQKPGQQQANGQKLGDKPGPGQKPGDKPGQKGDPDERNTARGEGDRQTPGKNRNGESGGTGSTADGTFINLQKRERDRVQQTAEAAFPAEFRELIKQYNINIKSANSVQRTKPVLPPSGGK
jgi:hypothetical protein